MTGAGHRVSALALAFTFAPWLRPEAAIAFGAGVLFAARAPDQLELSWRTADGGRRSLIRHRTITHWPWAWVALYWLGVLVVTLHDAAPLWAVSGFAYGGLLHVLTDYATPAGIPWGNPFIRNRGLALYRTGGAGELLALAVLGAGAAISWTVANPSWAASLRLSI